MEKFYKTKVKNFQIVVYCVTYIVFLLTSTFNARQHVQAAEKIKKVQTNRH